MIDAKRFARDSVEALNTLAVLATPGGYGTLVHHLGESAANDRVNSALRSCEDYAAVAARQYANLQYGAEMSSVRAKLRAAAEAWESGRLDMVELESVSRVVLESMGMPRR